MLLANRYNALQRYIHSSPPVPAAQTWQVSISIILCISGVITYLLPGGLTTGFLTSQQYSLPLPDTLWEYITFCGDKWVITAAGLTVCVRNPRFMLALIFAGLICFITTQGLKTALHTLRPPAVLPTGSFRQLGEALLVNSTPSGHTAAAFLAAGLASYLTQRAWVKLGLILAAMLIGYSRIAVGVHWPVDVLIGASIGLLSAWIGVKLATRLEHWLAAALYILAVLIMIAASLRLLSYTGGFADTEFLAVSISAVTLSIFFTQLKSANVFAGNT